MIDKPERGMMKMTRWISTLALGGLMMTPTTPYTSKAVTAATVTTIARG
jgi:hypothetical protein